MTRKGQVIVCEAEGADWLPFEPLVGVRKANKDKPALYRGVIWTKNNINSQLKLL